MVNKGLNPVVDYSALKKNDIEKFPKGGIPQGNPISAILSNLYLYELDKLSISNGWKMVRYADDMVFSVSNLEEAKLILSQVEKYLLDKRKLRIHPLSDPSNEKTNIYINPKKQRMKYLGVIFDGKNLYPTDECCFLLINKIKTILSKPPVKYVLQNRKISPDSVRFVQIRLRVGTNNIKLYQFGTDLL